MMVKLTYDFLIKGHKALGAIAMAIGVAVSVGSIVVLNIHPGLVVGATILAVLVKPQKSEKSKAEPDNSMG
ncbi:hypothetical protein JCM19233_3100 [Vibrio astriarenae]|nr:hypothetical protein JCM19233_3100 [Vibrio sp. C7]